MCDIPLTPLIWGGPRGGRSGPLAGNLPVVGTTEPSGRICGNRQSSLNKKRILAIFEVSSGGGRYIPVFTSSRREEKTGWFRYTERKLAGRTTTIMPKPVMMVWMVGVIFCLRILRGHRAIRRDFRIINGRWRDLMRIRCILMERERWWCYR